MDKIRLEILGLSSSQSQIGSFALVLGETEEPNRRLPIIIGGFEAQAIALEIENIKPNRPMTHDLFLSLTQNFNLKLEEVVITDLKEGVFYARLIVRNNGEVQEIDSRPSDAIAIAVRHAAPIFTYEKILAEAGIEVSETEEEEEGETQDVSTRPEERHGLESDPIGQKESSGTGSEISRKKRLSRLTDQMQEAIDQEDYEKAARLRDEIKRLQEEEEESE